LSEAGEHSVVLREAMNRLYIAVLDQVPLVATDISCASWLHDFMEVLPSPELSQALYTDFDQRGKPLMALVAFNHSNLTTVDPQMIQKVHGWISAIWQQEVEQLGGVQVDLQQLSVVLDRLIESLEWARQVWSQCFVGVEGVADTRAQGIQLWMPAWTRVVSKHVSAIGQMPPGTDWTDLKDFMIEARYHQQAMLASMFDRSIKRIYIDRWIIVLGACVRFVASHPPLVDIMMNEGLYWNAYRQEHLMTS
jgi:hypothetical protein